MVNQTHPTNSARKPRAQRLERTQSLEDAFRSVPIRTAMQFLGNIECSEGVAEIGRVDRDYVVPFCHVDTTPMISRGKKPHE